MFIYKRTEPVMIITLSAALLSTMSVIAILFFLFIDSYPVFTSMGLNFFVGHEWNPIEKSYGALPMICGSLTVTILSVAFALPVAMGSAIFVSEFLPTAWRLWVKGCIELLAGVPSIIYGLIGVSIISELIKSTFAINAGSSLLTASILLTIMILPTITTFSEDAIHNVPKEYREASIGLGLTRVESFISAVLPMAIPGILSSILLGVGRAMGETIAVMLVIGSIDKLPSPFYNILSPSQTMTSKLGREAAEGLGSGLHWNALVALGLILFVTVAMLTFIAKTISIKWEKR